MHLDSYSGRAATMPAPGYAHLSIAVGSEEEVDRLAERMKADEVTVVDGPRRTGDGFYECTVLDPEGNLVEFTG